MRDLNLSPVNGTVALVRVNGRLLAVRHNMTSTTLPSQVTIFSDRLGSDEFVDEGALRELAEETGVRVAPEDLEF